MKTNFIKYTALTLFILIIIACSTKKDTFINRNYHQVTSKYNVLYNGYLALDAGVADIKLADNENFWEILPIERMPETEENFLPGQKKNPNFERAEEKAVKAIQKHGMNIGGTERNQEMDEAYLLLAKARYYENRFIPALDALNYILYKHSQSNKIYHAKVWREKINIRLDQNETAIKNLKKMLQDNKVEDQDLADANAMLTQAYLNIKATDSAIASLKIAKSSTKNKEEQARYTFILGQLYENMNYNDSAFVAFQEVIDMNRNAPRRYVIQSHAKQAHQFNFDKDDTLLFVEKFDKLIKDRENRPYLDVLYFEKGWFYDKQNNHKQAVINYNKSLRKAAQDNYLIASNYRNIAEINFEEAKYKTAGKYYDSTLVKLDSKTREFRKIKKKRDNLEDVIKYETIAKDNDSILSIVAMNKEEQLSYFEKYIEKIKKEDQEKAKIAAELAKKEAIKAENDAKNNAIINKDNNIKGNNAPPSVGKQQGPSILPPSVTTSDDKNNFYFYNYSTVEFGKKEFISRWGKRPLVDNWKWASEIKGISKENLPEENSAQNKDVTNAIDENSPRYSTAFYLDRLPKGKKAIDSIAKDRNFAYYQLGLIYKEKFKEYELAANRLEKLLQNNPEERLILPANYNLYKIYQIINQEKAESVKNTILTNYPNTRYAQLIINPSLDIDSAEDPESVYKKWYKKYEENNFREILANINTLTDTYAADEIIPKFEMLKAKTFGRLKGLEEYKKGLNFVALTYPNTLEGKEAERLLKTDLPKLEAMKFGNPTATWKIAFPKIKESNNEELLKKIKKYFDNRKDEALKSSVDIYSENEDFVVIHGFLSKEQAQATLSLLREYKEYKINDEAFIITTEDYKVVQIKKEFTNWQQIK